MGNVTWVGSSEFWRIPHIAEGRTRYAFAASEEAVLETAFSPAFDRLQRLSCEAAIRCTSRYAQRLALDAVGLNPRWQPFHYEHNMVIKAPASCLNEGVRFLPKNEYVERLCEYDPHLATLGVIEKFVSGEAWEQDGFIIEGEPYYFNPVRQWWNEDFTKIEEYTLPGFTPHGLRQACEKAIGAIGLNNSCFCLELRRTEMGDWRLIEIHGRLPEDVGLMELLSDEDPMEVIEREASRVWVS